MESDEVAAQSGPPILVEARRQGLGRAISAGEPLPSRFGRRLAIERDALPRSPVAGQPLPRSAAAMLVGELDPSLRLLDGLLHQGHRLDAVTALV